MFVSLFFTVHHFVRAVWMILYVYLCVSIYQTCWKIDGALFLWIRWKWSDVSRHTSTADTHHDHQFCVRRYELRTCWILILEFVLQIGCLTCVRTSTHARLLDAFRIDSYNDLSLLFGDDAFRMLFIWSTASDVHYWTQPVCSLSLCPIPLFAKPFQVIIMMCFLVNIWDVSIMCCWCLRTRAPYAFEDLNFFQMNWLRRVIIQTVLSSTYVCVCVRLGCWAMPRIVLFPIYVSWSRIQLNHFKRNVNSPQKSLQIANKLFTMFYSYPSCLFLYSPLNRLEITQNKVDIQLAELTNITSEENRRAIRLPFHRVRRLECARECTHPKWIWYDCTVSLVDLTWIFNVCIKPPYFFEQILPKKIKCVRTGSFWLPSWLSASVEWFWFVSAIVIVFYVNN